MRTHTRVWTILGLLATVACSKPAEPLKMTAVDLGNQLNPDKRVVASSETFTTDNTVYASVAVEGNGAGTLTARWTSADGQVLAEQTESIAPTGTGRFEFHFAPPGGWPKGRHKVIISLDGGNSRPREFTVR